MATIANPGNRRGYLRVRLERDGDGVGARLTGEQGSGILSSVAKANGLAICPEDVPVKGKGEVVDVEMLDWNEEVEI